MLGSSESQMKMAIMESKSLVKNFEFWLFLLLLFLWPWLAFLRRFFFLFSKSDCSLLPLPVLSASCTELPHPFQINSRGILSFSQACELSFEGSFRGHMRYPIASA